MGRAKRLACRLVPTFFGLTPNDKERTLEEIFLLMYHGKFSYTEARRLPIPYRMWFIERIREEYKKERGEEKNDNVNQPIVVPSAPNDPSKKRVSFD